MSIKNTESGGIDKYPETFHESIQVRNIYIKNNLSMQL